ncbi:MULTISPECIES: hypothetical protein [Enterococcus]|jgi:hypothetical protein|uniref:Uncharacterized protein n=1 Tax=Enterococcus raffinosus ATCC 49464 TaxID=1158602 RepID=R2RM46_9ENTE|nr:MULTISPECIES: hypothetical protein [Enterococcus]EOH77024.1 hypothetical protein UAK_02597 [Enterococcus raffinosus ATCC 49464]EOT75717.1 hypothetical protein I590_02541 [Enterococcus raffinosus ATCC 49464]UXK03345.1 hypothetical protein N7K38_11860 [Enterococcus raffinosus]
MGKRINRYRIKIHYKDGSKLTVNGRVAVWRDEEFKDDLERVGEILDRSRIGWDGFMTLRGERIEENKIIEAIKKGDAEIVECKQTY